MKAVRIIGAVVAVALIAVVSYSIGYLSYGGGGIEPVRLSQFYGVSLGLNDDGEYCIDGESGEVRCAVPRLASGMELPDAGEPVRGGYGELPSDSSDLPEPTWIWLTQLACLNDGPPELACPDR